MSMVEKIRTVEREARRLMPGEPCESAECQDCEWDRALLAAIAAALAEAERFLAEVQRKDAQLARANERAEQAGAEWMRARDAWNDLRKDGAVAVRAFYVMGLQRRNILDQFFGGEEEES